MRTIDGFLLGAAVGAWASLRSGKWDEVRIVTLNLIAWNILNSLALFYGILFAGKSPALLPKCNPDGNCGLWLSDCLLTAQQVARIVKNIKDQ